MAVDSANILVGAPDQATTGAILSAPLGTALPTDALDTLDGAFEDSGYISEDGLTLTPDRSIESIKDWSGAIVRSILSEFNGSLAWSHLETNVESLKNWFGDDNVTVADPTVSSGTQITAILNASEMPRKSWVFKIKDGDKRVLIVVPDGQVTESGEVEFTTSAALTWPVTLTSYPDSSGNNVYVYTDDGVFSGSAVPAITSVLPGSAGEGDLVTITGVRFTGVTGATGVKFGGTNAAEYVVLNDTTIVASLPAGSAGSAAVVVTNGAGASNSAAYTRT